MSGKHPFVALSFAVVVGAGLVFLTGAARVGKGTAAEKVNKRLENLQEQITFLSRTAPPVGAVEAFAGEWPPAKKEGGRWTEEEVGWLLCDGRKLEGDGYAELRAVLGKAFLP